MTYYRTTQTGQFLVLTDVNFVTCAYNRAHIVAIALTYNGIAPSPHWSHKLGRPLVSVTLANGVIIDDLMVPTVDDPTAEQAERAVFEFFDALGAPVSRPTAS